MSKSLTGLRVAVLVADGFELHEMVEMKRALEEAGARTLIVSLRDGSVRGWDHDHLAQAFAVDVPLDRASAGEFDGLVVTGSILNQDALRHSPEAVRFIREFFAAEKPVAALCHGSQSLLEADVVRDRTLTSFPSARTDLISAGANWVDAAVVIDHGLMTSRSPADLHEFVPRLIAEFGRWGVPRAAAHAPPVTRP